MNNLFSRNLRNIIPLAICFALSASTSSLTVSASSIIGFDISSNKSLATLPLSFHLIGTMLSGLPASLLMKKIGRKYGFIFGTIIGLIGAASASLSIVYKHFPFLRFNRIGYLGIDIIRLNFFKKDLVTVEEKWETWTDLKGSRDRLDENIQERSDKWKKILNSPTGFLITVGLNF